MPASPPLVGATLTFLGEVSGSVFMIFAYKILVTLALSSFENCRAGGTREARRREERRDTHCLVETYYNRERFALSFDHCCKCV